VEASTLRPERPSDEDKQRFGDSLKRAIAKSDLKVKEIVLRSGLSYNSIKAYRMGKKFPLPESAAALAEVLNAPQLTRLAHIEIECPVCKKQFAVGSQKPRAVCSDACYQTLYSRKKTGRKRNALSRANREIARHREAVRLHCLDCTAGEYLCQMPDCELRPVSPLPLMKGKHIVQPSTTLDGPLRRVAPVRRTGIVLVRRDGH
jgi:transcriptional regulator with XRE-family HTH domain